LDHFDSASFLPKDAAMLVNQVLPEAQKRLVTIGATALLIDAAKALSNPHIELVVVCESDGKAVGVITKADVVRRITHCRGAECRVNIVAAMTKEMISCHPEDFLVDVWTKMKQHGLRHLPVFDSERRPVGIVNARDALQALLTTAANETELLRDCVMSVGYH
jgi:CBS domain-containing protein